MNRVFICDVFSGDEYAGDYEYSVYAFRGHVFRVFANGRIKKASPDEVQFAHFVAR